MTFDPTWTLKEATAAGKGYSGKPWLHPVQLWMAHQSLEMDQKSYEAGDMLALMRAINTCAVNEIVIPEWAAAAFSNGFRAVVTGRSGSWDDAFGRPHPKGTHLNAIRKRRALDGAVYWTAYHILEDNPEMPIDEHLFEIVGNKFAIGKTLAAELYYQYKNKISTVSANS